MILQIVVAVLVVLGAAFMCLAGLGILRMPDLFTRMHASTKGASLGVALLLIAAVVVFQDLTVAAKAFVTIAFIFLTAPVAAHMLGRAAYAKSIQLWSGSVIDEGRGKIAPGGEDAQDHRTRS
ncbi:MAG: monovalent cation/H(+) antiporter subunit G [Terrimicrobiaceae bacterium]|nr:monovalent cation/H(+) antiporter subunit G [Terrimicrobiaceae bacterium]